jgi:hypothetical protein
MLNVCENMSNVILKNDKIKTLVQVLILQNILGDS